MIEADTPPPHSRFAVFRDNPDYLKLWVAKAISDFGSTVSGSALAFTAVLLLHATPPQLGLLMICNLLPQAVAGPIAGVWVDRVRRRPLMIGADVGRALLLATIPLAAATGRLAILQLYGVTVGAGLLRVPFDIADRSFLPTLLGSDALVEGNSLLTATSAVSSFFAFSLAGWLVQWITGPVTVLVDAVSFLVSALLVSLIRVHEPAPERPVDSKVHVEMADGWRALARDRILMPLGLCHGLFGFSWGVLGAVAVAFMVRDLGFKPGVLGMIWGVGGIAAMGGALAASRLGERWGSGGAMAIGLALTALGEVFTPLAHGPTPSRSFCWCCRSASAIRGSPSTRSTR